MDLNFHCPICHSTTADADRCANSCMERMQVETAHAIIQRLTAIERLLQKQKRRWWQFWK